MVFYKPMHEKTQTDGRKHAAQPAKQTGQKTTKNKAD